MAQAQATPITQNAEVRRGAQKFTMTVRDVVDITPTTYIITLLFDNGFSLDWKPGQFISLFAEKEGKQISRPYSVASAPHHRDRMDLCIKVVEGGFMSNYLHQVTPGTRLRVMGPLGRFLLPDPIDAPIAFVATGTGVAPFVAMLDTIYREGTDHDMYLFFGVRYVRELVYTDFFRNLEKKHPNFHFEPTISRPETPEWTGRVGYVQKALQETIPNPGDAYMYICGLHEMVEQTAALSEQMGFKKERIRLEKWD